MAQLDIVNVLNELFLKKALLIEEINIGLQKCSLVVGVNSSKLSTLSNNYSKDKPKDSVFFINFILQTRVNEILEREKNNFKRKKVNPREKGDLLLENVKIPINNIASKKEEKSSKQSTNSNYSFYENRSPSKQNIFKLENELEDILGKPSFTQVE